MKIVDKGAPYILKRKDGKRELLIPCDVEFERVEAETFEAEAKRLLEEHLERAKERAGLK